MGLGFRAAERRAETLPVGETGGATGVGGFAGNRLHGMAKPWRKLGGSRSEGRWGQRPKHCGAKWRRTTNAPKRDQSA
ncbi:hypothetical protein [Sphingobium sp. CECT 9361]|uniref:hypothetical protein n=1 Tax=Sphingobium sp. CECT 9361 TaxID=2845384 RepID=UPI001E35F6E6|nr:hypothetical protein [Sphingobium sp. CECT 9361]